MTNATIITQWENIPSSYCDTIVVYIYSHTVAYFWQRGARKQNFHLLLSLLRGTTRKNGAAAPGVNED